MQKFKQTNDRRGSALSRLISWPGVSLRVWLLIVDCLVLTGQASQAQSPLGSAAAGQSYLPLVANTTEHGRVLAAALHRS